MQILEHATLMLEHVEMKALICISLCILMHSAISQVYIVQIDTVKHYTCSKEMTIENMVKTGKYDII